MARVYVTADGSTLIIPDSSIATSVISNPQGLATTGVIALVGEADQGPQWSQEDRLSSNSFGPGDINRVVAKYGSGRLVDAYRGAVAASASSRIKGSPQRFILVKSNLGLNAMKQTDDGHGKILADAAGAPGNSIKESISTAVDEVAPSTSKFSYAPSASGASADIRVNGGAKQALAISANTLPSSLAQAITALNNLNAVGGVNQNIMSGLSASNQIAVAVSGQNVTISLTAPAVFGASPAIGDSMNIPSGSVIAGVGNANVGWYIVTAVSNTSASASISAVKITAGAPVAVSSVALSATPANDLVDYSSISINNMSGTDRQVLTGLVGVNASVSVAGPAITFALATGKFASNPQIGDWLHIPSSSAYAGAGSANVGWYQVSAVNNVAGSAYVTASRLSNGSPVAVSSTAIAATSDVQVLDRQIRGVGKSMMILDNAGAVNINTLFLNLGTANAASWIGQQLDSASEFAKQFSFSNSITNVNESPIVGGHIALEVGYLGTTATMSIAMSGANLMLTTSVTGGSGTNLSIILNSVNTISDLCALISSNAGYYAQPGSGTDAQRSPMILDQVSNVGICSDVASTAPGLIKRDIWDLTAGPGNIAASSIQVTYMPIATAGLPDDEGPYFLSGGAKGGTTALQMAQSITALSTVRCNFVVPLVSQDATLDSAAGLTDQSSTYTVDAANAAARAHVIAMSTPKVKRHRVAQVSKLDTFQNQQSAAEILASFRCTMCFQSIKDLNSQGAIVTFQPWMGAAKVAGMQAAGFYKAIYNKALQISGVVNPVGFDDQADSLVEQAILSGMIPVSQMEDGSFRFRTDQTTYGVDNNFVYNSLQAVYVADIIALSLAQAIRDAFVGESVADVQPSTVISFVKAKMEEFLNKKLIVRSPQQGAPGGWISINAELDEDVLLVDAVVIEATSIRFAPITLEIEGIKASAAA